MVKLRRLPTEHRSNLIIAVTLLCAFAPKELVESCDALILSLGIHFTSTVNCTHLDSSVVKSICHEYKIHNADVCVREDCTAEDLIDAIEGSRVYIRCIYVMNKIDQLTLEGAFSPCLSLCSLQSVSRV